MSAHVLLNVLKEFGKEIKSEACRAFYATLLRPSIHNVTKICKQLARLTKDPLLNI